MQTHITRVDNLGWPAHATMPESEMAAVFANQKNQIVRAIEGARSRVSESPEVEISLLLPVSSFASVLREVQSDIETRLGIAVTFSDTIQRNGGSPVSQRTANEEAVFQLNQEAILQLNGGGASKWIDSVPERNRLFVQLGRRG